MRGMFVATIWLVVAAVGCSEPEQLTPRDEYEALEARAAMDCGTYERNYSPDDNPIPEHLCGPAPDIACINDAIAGATIAKLTYSYFDSQGLLREHHYYAGDGGLTWVGYYQRAAGESNWWYAADCTTLLAEPYEVLDQTCWTLKSTGCVAR